MFQLLHQYLIENSRLHMPGIGTLEFAEVPGRLDVDAKLLMPPRKVLRLNQDDHGLDKHRLMGFLSRRLDISEEQAWSVYHQYIESIRSSLSTRRILYWLNLGAFQKDESGVVQFVQTSDIDQYTTPVPAIRVIRSNPAQAMQVANEADAEILEAVTISDETETTVVKRNYWWVWAILILLASAALIWSRYASDGSFKFFGDI